MVIIRNYYSVCHCIKSENSSIRLNNLTEMILWMREEVGNKFLGVHLPSSILLVKYMSDFIVHITYNKYALLKDWSNLLSMYKCTYSLISKHQLIYIIFIIFKGNGIYSWPLLLWAVQYLSHRSSNIKIFSRINILLL